MAQLTVRVDDAVKGEADRVLQGLGISASGYLNMALVALAQEGGVPFQAKWDRKFWEPRGDKGSGPGDAKEGPVPAAPLAHGTALRAFSLKGAMRAVGMGVDALAEASGVNEVKLEAAAAGMAYLCEDAEPVCKALWDAAKAMPEGDGRTTAFGAVVRLMELEGLARWDPACERAGSLLIHAAGSMGHDVGGLAEACGVDADRLWRCAWSIEAIAPSDVLKVWAVAQSDEGAARDVEDLARAMAMGPLPKGE